ncbi:DUF1702 family protein [Salinactinospora qingdaonensis]|uniref:DUF1702 family protein n=1 Tax=Salinactinospora qingdaonensis TaxID=702744 RepID=A0ABP7FUD9_9ACTN
MSATRLENRGFHEKSPQARELLESIGAYFLTGYRYAAEAGTPAEAEARLEHVPTRFRGFAYEGAAMGFTIVDALSPRRRRLAGFLAGRGDHHVYMAYVGAGWAMARLPRFRRPEMSVYDPLLRWLVLDGYGFHQAYFHTERYVRRHFRDPAAQWRLGRHTPYAHRAVDQGIGRALWFVGGTDPERVATMIDAFPDARHRDLYSGAGLAATYAGGASETELVTLRERAGSHRPHLAQGSAFAAQARIRAGLLVPHTELATRVLCGMAPEEAAQVSEDARPADPSGHDSTGEVPAYEAWRARIADEFAALGRC